MEKAGIVLIVCAVIYLLAIRPGRGHRAEKMKGIYYAHRGLHDRRAGVPENSMEAFRRAVKAGYGIELDVRLTRDEEPVVFHDASLKRMCGAEGAVSDFTFRQLQEFSLPGSGGRIPRFADVLSLVNGKVPLLVEIKTESFNTRLCEKTDALLRGYAGDYVVESFHPWVLHWYRKYHPEVCRGQLSMNFQKREGDYRPERFLARHLMFNFIGKPDFIAYDLRDSRSVSRFLCRRLFGCSGAAWTVRSSRQLEKIHTDFDSYIFEGFLPEENNYILL